MEALFIFIGILVVYLLILLFGFVSEWLSIILIILFSFYLYNSYTFAFYIGLK